MEKARGEKNKKLEVRGEKPKKREERSEDRSAKIALLGHRMTHIIGERELVVQLARFHGRARGHIPYIQRSRTAEAHAHSPEIHRRRSFIFHSVFMATEHPTANMESVDSFNSQSHSP